MIPGGADDRQELLFLALRQPDLTEVTQRHFSVKPVDQSQLGELIEAGWSATVIVVISQLVAFLSYQIRVVAGLRVLKARPA